MNEELSFKYKNFKTLYLKDFSKSTLAKSIKNIDKTEPEFLVTSRLDNDDALHPNYMKVVKSHLYPKKHTYYLNILNGYLYNMVSSKSYYVSNYHTNPFLTMVEHYKQDFIGVYGIGHDSIRKTKYSKYVVNIASIGWLICIHDRNVSNKNVGKRCRKSDLKDFVIPIAEKEPDSIFKYYLEILRWFHKKKIVQFKDYIKNVIKNLHSK